MLVLSRKQQQQIKIGDQITLTIVRVKGNTVRVGIEAPRNMRVIRAELPKTGGEVESCATLADDATNASEHVVEQSEEAAQDRVISFRVRCEAGDDAGSPDATPTRCASAPVPATSHLPLKRVHDRFGNAPLKQLLASCATLAK